MSAYTGAVALLALQGAVSAVHHGGRVDVTRDGRGVTVEVWLCHSRQLFWFRGRSVLEACRKAHTALSRHGFLD